MKGISLKEHIKRSKQAVAANKAKGNRHAELLADMYSKPARFIDEILQNTEDAYARKSYNNGPKSIKFELFQDRIEISHNGEDFDEEDLKSITTFANTTKNNVDEVNQIGKFGIGFKSVFAITDEPEIHSAAYHYKITDFEILTKTSKCDIEDSSSTLFVMPFKADERRKIYNIVRQGLNELNAYYLLFLTHINKIEIKLDTKKTNEFIEKEVVEIEDEIQKVIVKSSVASRVDERFLLLTKKKQHFHIAFKIKTDKGKESIEPIRNSKLFVYFPTLQESHLNFLVNASFATTPTRESVPFDKFIAKENITLINEIADFFSSKLTRLRDIGYFDIEYLNILPLKKPTADMVSGNENLVYKVFYDVILKKLSEKKLILTESGKFQYAKNMALASDVEICQLLKKGDLKALFSRNEWVNSKVNNEGFEDLRKYLSKQLNILEVGFEKFTFHLSLKPDFLKLKNDKWFIQFYSILHNKRYLWSKENQSQYYSLRTKAFIKLNDNSISEAFDKSGNSIIYLPTKHRIKYKIVKRAIAKNQQALEFFKDFGLTEPNELAEFIEIILKKYNKEFLEIHSRTYKSDIREVLRVYNDSDILQKEKLLSVIKEYNLFEAYNPVSKQTKFCKSKEIILSKKGEEQSNNFHPSSRLQNFFKSEIKEQNLFQQLLEDLGLKYSEDQKDVENINNLSEQQKSILEFIESKRITVAELEKLLINRSSNKIEIKPENVNVKARDFDVLKDEIIPSNVLSSIPISDLSKLSFPDFSSKQENNELINWSQELVLKWIIENELNETSKIHKIDEKESGFSFEVRSAKTTKYIAVVAKQIFDDNYQISKTIWKAAEKFNSLFWFYCIPNAGLSCTEIIRIQNPYKLWQEGKLSFNTLSFRL
ncbi:sacsin N-terminal ATP-binding-like domain-containing protein [Bacteroidota bacterium]